jgi:hypothetical protein
MTTRRSRAGAYADLVAGLLDVRPDAATERFDAELEAAEADGRIDPQTAKVLRWWQRESLRAMVEHARAVVPPTLLALEASAAGAQREVESSSQSWARADEAVLAESAESAYGGESAESAGSAYGVDSSESADSGDYDESDDASDEDSDAAGAGVVDVTAGSLPPPADLTEHRRRLLVAGLTRVRG